MSNDVQAIQTRWEKIYQKIRPYRAGETRVVSLSTAPNIKTLLEEHIKILESINTHIKGLQELNDNCFEEISIIFSNIEYILDNRTIYSNKNNIPDKLKVSILTELNSLLEILEKSKIRSLFPRSKNTLKYVRNNIDNLIPELSAQVSNLTQKIDDISQNIDNERIQQLNDELEKLKNIAKNQIDEQNKNFDTLSQTLQENINRIDVEMKNIHFIYDKQYKKLSESLMAYNILFVCSLVAIFIISIALFKDTISLNISLLTTDLTSTNPLSIILSNLSLVITNFLIKLPFLIPFIWLSIFFSNRRAEIHRLQQEYLHKSTFAQSYLKYEEQIKNLPEDKQGDLLATLLDKLIETVSFNPSTTLDKKANKDISLEDVYNCLEKERTHFEKIRDFFKKDDGNKEKES